MARAKQFAACFLAFVLLMPSVALVAQETTTTPQVVLRATTELVLVNVVARDKKGNLVRDLKKEDFTLLEDGKKQQISSFDFEDVDQIQNATQTVSGASPKTPGTLLHATKKSPPTLDARDRRLILLFLDFSAMQPEEIERAVDAAKKFVATKMQPADLIALVSLATNMHVDLDFTDDKEKIAAALTPTALLKARASTMAQPEAPKALLKPAAPSPKTTPTSTHSPPTANSSLYNP